MKLFRVKLNNKGLSFVELLVVIGVIMTMTSIAFLGNGAINSGRKVKMSAQKLASDIRKMQGYVLNLQDHSGTFPDGGWGVYFDKLNNNDRYYLFADDGSNSGREFYYDAGELFQEIMLPKGIIISNIDADANLDQDQSSINFSPPDPTAHLCRNWGQCNAGNYVDKVLVTLSNNDGSVTKIVEINKYGLVDVQN